MGGCDVDVAANNRGRGGLQGERKAAFTFDRVFDPDSQQEEIYDYAAAYARRVGLDADLPEAVRSTGVEPEERRVADLEVGIDDALSALHDSVDGTIGIVVPLARRSGVQQWLSASRWADDAAGDDARIVVLTGLDTKGLEFDGIVVAQPQEIEDESPTGRATLYVVLTRATQRLITLSQIGTE